MSILSIEDAKKIDLKYRIYSKHASTSITYRTQDNLILKKFIFNQLYRMIVRSHNNQFAEYLDELSKLKEEFLVVPKDIYLTRNKHVALYTYEYQYGTTIDKMYPRTDLNNLFIALESFFSKLEKMDYLKLKDMHSGNIIYTGDIKLIDLDMCFFDSDVSKDNIRVMNNGLFRGIFNISHSGEIIILEEFLKNMYESMINGEINVCEFLKEYREFIINRYGECKYVKHLRKELIGEIK